MNRGQGILMVLVISIIVYFIYQGMQVSHETQSDKTLKELYSIKDALIPKKYMEKYRSADNNGLTIIGTVMEQVVDVMINILKQDLPREIIDTIVEKEVDAVLIAEAIETVGSAISNQIKNLQILKKSTATDGRPVYEPNQESNFKVYNDGLLGGMRTVLEDESKYDSYYDAFKRIVIATDKHTNPGRSNDDFPTKEVFKTQLIPMMINEVKTARAVQG